MQQHPEPAASSKDRQRMSRKYDARAAEGQTRWTNMVRGQVFRERGRVA